MLSSGIDRCHVLLVAAVSSNQVNTWRVESIDILFAWWLQPLPIKSTLGQINYFVESLLQFLILGDKQLEVLADGLAYL